MYDIFGEDVVEIVDYEYTPQKINPFDFVNSITSQNVSMYNDDSYVHADLDKQYNTWLTNMALANYNDTIFYANEMNKNHGLSSKMQYDYLFHSIRKYKRRGKWGKRVLPDDIDLVKTYYNYNTEKATQALKLLTKDNLDYIKASYYQGGIGGKVKK